MTAEGGPSTVNEELWEEGTDAAPVQCLSGGLGGGSQTDATEVR